LADSLQDSRPAAPVTPTSNFRNTLTNNHLPIARIPVPSGFRLLPGYVESSNRYCVPGFGFVRTKKHMATQKQIAANRRNALRSTGPRTPKGKAIVAMNSLRHGLRARTVILPGEKRHKFHQLCDYLKAQWQPQSVTEQFCLMRMAVSRWKLMRLEVNEIRIVRRDAGAGNRVLSLERLWEAQCRLERSYARAQRELERLQSALQPPAVVVGCLQRCEPPTCFPSS
jgi:hypothetical protein